MRASRVKTNWLSLGLLSLGLLIFGMTFSPSLGIAAQSGGLVSIIVDKAKAGSLSAGDKLDILAVVDRAVRHEIKSVPCESTGRLAEGESESCLSPRPPTMISVKVQNSTPDSDDFARDLMQLLSDRYQNTQIVVHQPVNFPRRNGILGALQDTGSQLCLLPEHLPEQLNEKKKCERRTGNLLEAQIRINP